MLRKYRLGFDIWGLLLFLLVMIPNCIWFAVPAPNDVLRTESATPVVDIVASVCQVLLVACLCFLLHKEQGRLRFSPLVVAAIACVVAYYLGWIAYYSGITRAWVILLMTIPPCAAFLLFAVDRKNLPAALFASVFAVCHLIYGIVNFII